MKFAKLLIIINFKRNEKIIGPGHLALQLKWDCLKFLHYALNSMKNKG